MNAFKDLLALVTSLFICAPNAFASANEKNCENAFEKRSWLLVLKEDYIPLPLKDVAESLADYDIGLDYKIGKGSLRENPLFTRFPEPSTRPDFFYRILGTQEAVFRFIEGNPYYFTMKLDLNNELLDPKLKQIARKFTQHAEGFATKANPFSVHVFSGNLERFGSDQGSFWSQEVGYALQSVHNSFEENPILDLRRLSDVGFAEGSPWWMYWDLNASKMMAQELFNFVATPRQRKAFWQELKAIGAANPKTYKLIIAQFTYSQAPSSPDKSGRYYTSSNPATYLGKYHYGVMLNVITGDFLVLHTSKGQRLKLPGT